MALFSLSVGLQFCYIQCLGGVESSRDFVFDFAARKSPKNLLSNLDLKRQVSDNII